MRLPSPFDTRYRNLTREVGATALIGTERRQRKRKAPDSDKVTTNDEDATDDANCFVRAEQAGERPEVITVFGINIDSRSEIKESPSETKSPPPRSSRWRR